ncbi:hypothetical protein B0H65DRAFT_550918 [Neurospora tetraspora]|uniref:Uncharacterized protein n=1 Tax=Neurospora tetraspora TaxID=94610 RepID=A0AAE0JAI9_9PEZI|nr:hypothetical protein B0H65DRAFT_550918 [Neurospora tetraspora]
MAPLLGPWFPTDSRGLEQGLGEGLEGYLMNRGQPASDMSDMRPGQREEQKGSLDSPGRRNMAPPNCSEP